MKRTIYVVCIIALLSAILLVTPAAATFEPGECDITVCTSGCDHSSIQNAIVAATDGDIICVYNGTYDQLRVDDKSNITVKGESADLVTLGHINIGHFGDVVSGVTIDGFTATDFQGLTIEPYNTSDCTVRNCVFDGLPYNIKIGQSDVEGADNIVFENNVVQNSTYHFTAYFGKMDAPIIANNVFKDNAGGSILNIVVKNGKIFNNIFINNTKAIYGSLVLEGSYAFCFGNIITNNNFISNTIGICVFEASNNTIYLNNFVNNTETAYDASVEWNGTPGHNFWNSTEPLKYIYNGTTYTNYLGNYWGSNYTGTDADGDGIGDTAYDIPGSATDKDYYPLMAPFENYPASAGAGLADSAWPTFGHDLQNTGQSPYVGPQEPVVKWAVQTSTFGGGVSAQPVIGCDGTIYIGTLACDDGKFYAFNPDGTVKWIYQPTLVLAPGREFWGTAVIGADGTVYIAWCSNYAPSSGEGEGVLSALNPADGSEKWRSTIVPYRVYCSPKIGTDGTIYWHASNYLYAVNPDGTNKWNFTMGAKSHHSALAIGDDDAIYIGSYDGKLYAVNPNGTEKWSFLTQSDLWCRAVSIAADGTIYICTYNGNTLYAVNPDGTLKWSFDFTKKPNALAFGADGTVYVSIYDGNMLCAINPNGTQKWQFTTGSSVRGAPAVGDDGTIYFGSYDKKIYALNLDGTEKWNYTTDYEVGGSPSIDADGTLYVQSGKAVAGAGVSKLYAFGPPLAGLCGDVNNDGKVTMGDGRLIYLNVIYGDAEYPLANPSAADVNGDGKITMGDGRLVYLHVIYGNEEYPLECGS